MKNAEEHLQKMIEELGININPQIGDGTEGSTQNKLDPKKIMDNAYNSVEDAGSSTCCIGVLNHDRLDIANLGDSGFMVFEYKYENGRYKVFLKERSKPQQHTFNYPYQLVRLPNEDFHSDLAAEGHEHISDELRRLVESDAIL